MTPPHTLAMKPHAPEDSIAALLNSNIQAVFSLDHRRKTPLDNARDYNVGGLVGMVRGLCNFRNSMVLAQTDTSIDNEQMKITAKRRRIEFE